MIKRLVIPVLTLSLLFYSRPVQSQDLEFFSIDTVLALPDTVKTFSINDLYTIIFANHPIVKQAALLEETARQEIRLARGSFDPKLEAAWDIKEFNDTEYYNMWNTTLKVPIWFPIDPKVSVDRNRGVYLNPENVIPESNDFWQVTTGVSLPVGKGLIIDNRRATVKQAILFQDILEAEQIKMVNKILLEASKDYWNWYFDYYNYLLLQSSIVIAQQIFDRVKLNFEFGEAAVVDTVQAQITLQNRTIEAQEATVNFLRSGLILSNHLWGDNEEPLELTPDTGPALADSLLIVPNQQDLETLLNLARNNHPELVKLSTKIEQLAVDNRLNKENLKPQLDLNYNLIDRPLNHNGESPDIILDDNYKFGMTFSFPLLLRKERAKLQKTNIKILETQYDLNFRRKEILNEVNGFYALLTNTSTIIQQQRIAVDNYQRLLQAELFNLENGESDLFRINFQQDALIQARSKLLKLRTEYEKARVNLLWAAGVPNLDN
ncbi:MAG: TolC family protein [Cytophagales bacterium]|nr:TolC family protein [Cytophagales bacterium]